MASFAKFGNDLYTGARSVDFVGKRRIWYSIAIVLIVLSIAIPFIRGGGDFFKGFDFGIDFTGGSQFQISDAKSTNTIIGQDAVLKVVPGANVQVTTARVADQREALRLAELGPRAEEVAAGEAQLQATQAQLELLEYQISQGQLKAPADAVVRSRLLEPGDMATPQRPVFALALTDPKWVRVYVNEPDLGRVRPGMAARVVTDSEPDRPIDGKVGYISSVAEFTPKSVQTEELRTSLVYEVRVLVEDAKDVLRLGQPATVRLVLNPPQ